MSYFKAKMHQIRFDEVDKIIHYIHSSLYHTKPRKFLLNFRWGNYTDWKLEVGERSATAFPLLWPLKYSQSRDLEGIQSFQWILWILYTDTAHVKWLNWIRQYHTI